MNEVKRFVRYLIENDLAFTHIDEAVRLFSEYESDLQDGLNTWKKLNDTAGTADQIFTKYEVS